MKFSLSFITHLTERHKLTTLTYQCLAQLHTVHLHTSHICTLFHNLFLSWLYSIQYIVVHCTGCSRASVAPLHHERTAVALVGEQRGAHGDAGARLAWHLGRAARARQARSVRTARVAHHVHLPVLPRRLDRHAPRLLPARVRAIFSILKSFITVFWKYSISTRDPRGIIWHYRKWLLIESEIDSFSQSRNKIFLLKNTHFPWLERNLNLRRHIHLMDIWSV